MVDGDEVRTVALMFGPKKKVLPWEDGFGDTARAFDAAE